MKARLKLNLFCSICYNKIFLGKEILLEKCKKIGRFFELDFRALPRSGAFTSRDIKNISCTTSIFCLSSVKISNVYLYPFWRNDLDKTTYQKSQNRRYFETGSDVIKTKKSIIDLYHKVSYVKISWKSIESFSRNRRNKIGKKTRHDLVASNEEVFRPIDP